MIKLRPRYMAVLTSLAFAACGGQVAGDQGDGPATGPARETQGEERTGADLAARREARERLPLKLPARVPPAAARAAATGEVPADLLARMKADLGERTGASADALEVVAGESVVWPDGSLGCPLPGRSYTQSTVPGYRVVLAHGEERYAYHASRTGYFVLCGATPAVEAPR